MSAVSTIFSLGNLRLTDVVIKGGLAIATAQIDWASSLGFSMSDDDPFGVLGRDGSLHIFQRFATPDGTAMTVSFGRVPHGHWALGEERAH